MLAILVDWDIAETGGQNTVWRIYDGHSTPLLAHFLTDISFNPGTGNSLEKVYDGSAIDASGAGLTLASGAFKAGDSVTDLGGSISGAAIGQKKVDSYLLGTDFFSTNQQGYDIENLSNGTLTITPRELMLNTDYFNKTYDGDANVTEPIVNAAFSNIVSDTLSYSGVTASFVDKNAGTGKVISFSGSLTGAAKDNYTLVNVSGDIGKATLTVTANNKSREYGEANPTFDGVISGFKNDETATVVSGLGYSSTATAQSDVGSYDITASGATATNYAFEYEAGELTVGKATLTVSANDKSREYGEANPTFDGVISGFKNSETASVIDSGSASYSSTASTSSNVGDYTITASGTYSDNNYAFEYEAGELTVGKATLTVSANNKSREYGEANPTFDGVISGFKNSETATVVSGLNYSSTATAQSDVGSYDITASEATATNCSFTYVNGDLEIMQKVLTFSKPTVADKTYDGSDSVTFDESEISFYARERRYDRLQIEW